MALKQTVTGRFLPGFVCREMNRGGEVNQVSPPDLIAETEVGYFPHKRRELSSIFPLKRRFCIVLVQLFDNPAADSKR